MSRLTVFSFCAALAGAVQLSPAGANPSEPEPAPMVNDKAMGEAIEAAVAGVFSGSSNAVVRVESGDELGKVAGTGFFIDTTGHLYTLSSVVADGLGITVTHDGKSMPARLLTKDARSGIALLKVDEAGPTPFLNKGDCRELRVASPLIVVGFPYDHEVTPSFGVIGGFDRQSKGKFFTTTHIRANVPVQRGQAGSPALNLDGEVVGVLVSGFEEGAGCYVLPIRAAEKVRADYTRFGQVRHGWAGVTVQEIPVPVEGSRMAVDMVDPSGPAAAQFRPGDIILQVGDIAIREPEDALDASFFLTAGDAVDVKVSRNGEVLTLPFVAEEHPADRTPNLQALGPGSLMP
jgi:serine protease Do